MKKEELLKKYNIEEFLKLHVDEQAEFINKAYEQGISDGDLADVFGVSPSTFLFKIRGKYKKKRNANKFYKKEILIISEENNKLNDDNVNKNIDISISELNDIKNEIVALKKEMSTIRQNKIDVNTDNSLFNIKDKHYNQNLVLRHYKLNETIANEFDKFCDEAIINKQVLLGKALQEFLEKYNK